MRLHLTQCSQAVAALFVASKVTSWFSFITLSYIGASARSLQAAMQHRLTPRPAVLALFSVPKLYLSNQPLADSYLAMAEKELTKLWSSLPDLPKAKKLA